MSFENELFHKIKKMIIEYHNIPEVSFTDDDLIKKLKENNFEVKYKSDSEKSGLIFVENTNSNNIWLHRNKTKKGVFGILIKSDRIKNSQTES